MPARIPLRPLTAEEKQQLEQIARSPLEPTRCVERATIILSLSEGQSLTQVARALRISHETVRQLRRRYNELGLDVLNCHWGGGRSVIYDAAQRGRIIQAARSNPAQLGLPFDKWTLKRLAEYVNSTLGIPMSRSRINEILKHAGLRWHPRAVPDNLDPANGR